MIKLITPPGLLLTTALLAIYAIAAGRVAYLEESAFLAAAAALSAIACYGTAMMKRWSQYLVYALALGFALKWGWSVYDGYRTGYFDFRFGSATAWRSLRPMVPGFVMVVLSGVCAWLVRRSFARMP
jgi:hypothetical protein